MLILIICISLLGICVAAYLTYAGVDSVLKNKKQEPDPKPQEQPTGLYRVRSYSFAYKKREGESPKTLFSATALYPNPDEEDVAESGVHEERR